MAKNTVACAQNFGVLASLLFSADMHTHTLLHSVLRRRQSTALTSCQSTLLDSTAVPTKYIDTTFSVIVGLMAWNSLPDDLCDLSCTSRSFRQALTTSFLLDTGVLSQKCSSQQGCCINLLLILTLTLFICACVSSCFLWALLPEIKH